MTYQNVIPIEQIAEICHEANAVYCRQLGDDSQKPWKDAPKAIRDSAINGVKHFLETGATAEEMHENWMREKLAAGWTYGPEKDLKAKTHPCIMRYVDLPGEQKLKDQLFRRIVRAFAERVSSE